MQIERATSKDCRAIAEVHVASWQSAYRGILSEMYLASLSVAEREARWICTVEHHLSHLLLARAAGEVVGFIAFGASRDEDAPASCAEIWAVYVKPDLWSAGAGRQLWLAALQQLTAEGYRTITLWVIVDNERAIRFYEHAGFVVEPSSRKQLERGGTAIEEVRYVYVSAG